MATEEKKVSKLDSILNKIDAFFEGLMSKKADDLEEDDDMESKKADDDEAKKSKKFKKSDDEDAKKSKREEDEEGDEDDKESKKSAKSKTKKATDDEDSQDPDDDDDDDEDKEIKKDAEVKRLNSVIAKQNKLLKEAQSALAERDEDIRETIKSSFKPTGSQRSNKIGVKGELPSWAQPQTELGKKAVQMAAPKRK
jgi:hypothetical protein